MGNARAANTLPRIIKKQLADPTKSWHLEPIDNDDWNFCQVGNKEKADFSNLRRYIARDY